MGSRKRFESFACCMTERANVTRHMRGSGGNGLCGEKICRRVSRALARGKETRKACGFPIIEMEMAKNGYLSEGRDGNRRSRRREDDAFDKERCGII